MRRSSNKTIGIVLSTVPKYSETFFRNKIKGLQDNGFEVYLFVEYKSEESSGFPCKVIIAPNFGNNKALLLKSIRSFLRCMVLHPKKSIRHLTLDKRDGYSFVHRVKRLVLNEFLFKNRLDWLHFGYGMQAINRENVAKAIKAKMAVSFRGSDFYLTPVKHKGCYDRLFKKDVKYHVLSDKMKDGLVAKGILSDHIKVITPAIDTELFNTTFNSNSANMLQFVTVARLHWVKGLDYTLEALKILKERGMKFKYTIVGAGEEAERLKFTTYQLELQDCVQFKGKLPHNNVKELLTKADIYIQYSIQEGFCNAVLEAQAMGLLTIVSDADGLTENVQDQSSGWVIPRRQPKLLAKKIEEISKLSKAQQDRIRTYAKSRVVNEFNLPKQNHAFQSFYSN